MPSAERPPKNPRHVAASAPGGPGYLAELTRVALGSGLERLGVAPVAPFLGARAAIEDRIERDLVNGMRFTFLNPVRSTTPDALVEGARSILVALLPYAHEDDDDLPDATGTGPVAVVARYARRDHIADLKAALVPLVSRLRGDGHRAVVFADDNSLVDREAARLAGLGWFGKNANILAPGRGSWFVIGCVVTTADLPVGEPVEPGCGSCVRCMPACPTGAIIEPGVVDANRCLSWLLQKPGSFAREHRVALGNRIYGCDDCQSACPVNRRNAPPDPGARAAAGVDVLGLLALDDAALDRSIEGWWVAGRDMTWVRRNLLLVLGNVGDRDDPRVVAAVGRHARHANPHLRAHALWAAARLGLDGVLERARTDDDPSPEVLEELAHLPPLREDL